MKCQKIVRFGSDMMVYLNVFVNVCGFNMWQTWAFKMRFSIMLCQDTLNSLCLYKSEADHPIRTSSVICQSCGRCSSQSSSTWPWVLQHALWCRCSNESKCWITFCWLVIHHSPDGLAPWKQHKLHTQQHKWHRHVCAWWWNHAQCFSVCVWYNFVRWERYRAHNYFMEVRYWRSFIWSHYSPEEIVIIQRL